MPRTFTYDNELLLKDAGLVDTDGVATVAAAAKVIDLGSGRVDGTVVIDATAVEVATGDEKYQIELQGSNAADMSAGKVTLAATILGDAAAINADSDAGPGRYEMPFTNEQNGTIYRYVRLYTDVTGTIATGANFSAFIAKA